MLTTGTSSEGRTWTMMYPQFLDELCTNNISDRAVFMAEGGLANLGWPAWSSTETVIMPTALDIMPSAVNTRYWIVAVLHWHSKTVEFFDTNAGPLLHKSITMIFDRIKKYLPAFLKKLGLKEKAKDAKKITLRVSKSVPAIKDIDESGPQVCQILSAFAAGRSPSSFSVDQLPNQFRRYVSTMLWADVVIPS